MPHVERPVSVNEQIVVAAFATAARVKGQHEYEGKTPFDILSILAGEFQNRECKVRADGEVWDSHGDWWNEERKEKFLTWLDRR